MAPQLTPWIVRSVSLVEATSRQGISTNYNTPLVAHLKSTMKPFGEVVDDDGDDGDPDHDDDPDDNADLLRPLDPLRLIFPAWPVSLRRFLQVADGEC